jgi:hypothetical protein
LDVLALFGLRFAGIEEAAYSFHSVTVGQLALVVQLHDMMVLTFAGPDLTELLSSEG